MRNTFIAYSRASAGGLKIPTWCFMVLLCSLAVGLLLRPGGNALAVSADSPANFARISGELAANKPAETADAVRRITVLVKHYPYQCDWRLAVRWLPALLARRQYPAVEDLAKREILAVPGSTEYVQQMLAQRIKALLAMDKDTAALSEAKSLFDFCDMRETATALKLVARCLKAASPNGAYEVGEFKQQEIAGAATPKPGSPPITCPVLAAIKIHGAPYLLAAWAETGQQLGNIIARGNLLLLAGHVRQARACMNCAFAAAVTPPQLAAAARRVAACIKAQDGTIGRANAWVDRVTLQ